MKTLLCILFLSLACIAQDAPNSPNDIKPEPPKCVHESDDDFYDSLHHTAPVRILMIDGRTVTTVRMTKMLIRHDTFSIDLKTIRMPKDVYKISKDRLYLLLYCSRHRVVFVIEELPKK